MEYERLYWLLFVGCGLLLAVGEVPLLLMGQFTLGSTLSVLFGGVIAIGGVYALNSDESRGAPSSLNLRFAMVAFAFLLLAGTTLQSLL
jgi:hypothetical protein